jgi:hypothetical protein
LTDQAIQLPRFIKEEGTAMIILGVLLLVLGYFLGIGVLETIGLILLIVGVVLWLFGALGRPVGGRRAWY